MVDTVVLLFLSKAIDCKWVKFEKYVVKVVFMMAHLALAWAEAPPSCV